MKNLLLASVFLAFAAPAAAQSLNVQVLDNGVPVGLTSSISGAINLIASDPNFSELDVTAAGVPDLTGANLSSVTLNVTSASITTTHNLEIDIFQTGVSAAAGITASTFTANDLVGDPGPTTESTFAGGTASTLGTLVATSTFPAGTLDGSTGPVDVPWTAFASDAQQYLISFTGPDQTATDTIQFSAAVPEPATWIMLLVGLMLVGGVGWRKRPVNHIG